MDLKTNTGDFKLKRPILVGDSGGTGTDWCFIDRTGKKIFFSGPSYQPIHFSEKFFQSMSEFWRSKKLGSDAEIHFYGAGCSMKHNQEILEAHFNSLGFQNVRIESDLLGACHGLLKHSPGFAGILGTGSALAEYNGQEIVDLRGGFGYLIGDEGSGYHFGKMLIHKYLNHTFSAETTEVLHGILGDRPELMKKVYDTEGKQWIGSLASRIERLPEIEALHQENILKFIDAYFPPQPEENKIVCFLGSYAFHNSHILKVEMLKSGWNLGEIIEKPITHITDYAIESTF